MNQLRCIVLIAACLLAAECPSSAQTGTGVPFLLFPSSPETYAMGGMSSALQFTHPMAAVGNPAQLGFSCREGLLTAGLFMPSSNYLPAYQLPDASYSTVAVNAAMDLNDMTGLPLSVGLGYSRNSMYWGEFIVTNSSGPSVIDKFESHESSDNISLGAGLDYWVRSLVLSC